MIQLLASLPSSFSTQLDYVILLFCVFILATILRAIISYKGKASGIVFIYFFSGTLAFGLIRLLFILVDRRIIPISDSTLMVCWHVIFYYASYLFLAAVKELITLFGGPSKELSFHKAVVSGLIGLIVTVIVFTFAPLVDPFLTKSLDKSWIESTGILHFIAFAQAGYIAYYLAKIKYHYKGLIGAIVSPFGSALFLLSLVHAWELLTESWKVVIVTNTVGELVERLLWLPAFICIYWVFYKLRFLISGPKSSK